MQFIDYTVCLPLPTTTFSVTTITTIINDKAATAPTVLLNYCSSETTTIITITNTITTSTVYATF